MKLIITKPAQRDLAKLDKTTQKQIVPIGLFLDRVVVVCDESKLRKTGYFGVPALIIEISSPSTARNDKLVKFNKFEKAGVQEYWIVEPDTKLVSVFTLQDNNRYGRPEMYIETDHVEVSNFPDLMIDLSTVFNF